MATAPADTSEQPTLRVMRLYKPRLDGRRALPSCSTAEASATATPSRRGEGDFALSSALKLPDSFGNIYLGETFTAYIRHVRFFFVLLILRRDRSRKQKNRAASAASPLPSSSTSRNTAESSGARPA